MIELEIKDNEDTAVLTLKGDLSICEVGQLKEALVNALGTAGHVLVDVTDVSDIDVSCLQLLCSAHRTSVTMNKTLALSRAATDEFSNIAVQCGLSRHIGCALDSQKSCIWVEGPRGWR